MSLILPRRFKSQPQQKFGIARGPLSDELVAACVPGMPEFVQGAIPVISDGFSQSVGREGICALGPSAQIPGYVEYTLKNPAPITGDYAFLIVASAATSSVGLSTHTFVRTGSLGISGFSVSSGSVVAQIDNNNTPTISSDNTQPAVFLAQRVSNRAHIWRNGVSGGSNVTGTRTGAISSLIFGRDKSSNNSTQTASYIYLLWNRSLSDAEAKAVSENPWQVFRAPPRRLWAVSTGGTTHDLVGAASTQSNAASTVAITQAHALTGTASTQANAAATGAITQGGSLAADNVIQSNAGSTGSITQTHALVADSATQANSASTGAITQGAQFAADPATQPNTAGTGAITQAHALIAANSTQSNTASAASITQAHTLTGASATQPNVAATGAISQGVVHDLVASQSTQANTGSAGAITQAHVLVSAPSVQDNIAAASAIVQAHVLIASPAAQGNSASSGAISAGDNALVSIVERTAVFQRSKSVTVRFN